MCENDAEVDAIMPASKSEAILKAERIYARHIKPLEPDHSGEYALVTPDGIVYFAPSLLEVARKAQTMPSEKNLLFKVGDIAASHVL